MPFSDADRRIFTYRAAGRELHADPLALRRKLYRVFDGDPDGAFAAADVKQGQDGQPEAPAAVLYRLDAEDRLVAGLRQLFDLPALDGATGQGFTEADVWDAWDAFQGFLAGEPSRGGNSPASQQPTAACPAP